MVWVHSLCLNSIDAKKIVVENSWILLENVNALSVELGKQLVSGSFFSRNLLTHSSTDIRLWVPESIHFVPISSVLRPARTAL